MHTVPTPTTPARFAPSPLRLVALLIVVGTALRVSAAVSVGLGNDEGYHYTFARHLDLCYFEHAPMFAWLGRLGLELGGDTALAFRLPFIALFALTTWLMFSVGSRLFGPWAGLGAALLLNLAPVFSLTTATCVLPDGPLMMSWIACTACLARIFLDPELRWPTLWWLAAGLFLGLALLSKFHGFFLAAGAVLFVLTCREQRHWLWRRGPYLGVLVAAVVFSPVLIWNYRNDWITFTWQGERGLASSGLHPIWLARSIGGQAMWLTPLVWGALIWELCRCLRRGPGDRPRWLVACLAVVPIVFFTAISVYAPIGFLFHWQAPGYLLLFLPLGASLWRGWTGARAKLSRTWLAAASGSALAIMAAVTTHAANGWWLELMPASLAAEAAPVDPTLEALDLAPIQSALAERGLLDRDDVFVFTNRWFLSGRVNFALHGRAEVLCLSPNDPRGFAFFTDQRSYLGKDGIFLSTAQFSPTPQQEFAAYFDRVETLGRVVVERGGRPAQTWYVHRCVRLHTTITQPYGLNSMRQQDHVLLAGR
jgi:hypothetical protein